MGLVCVVGLRPAPTLCSGGCKSFFTLVTSLSKSLAHQANLTVTHTAFLGLKRRQFFLLHLLSYFSKVSKRAMLSSPVVLASSLFAEEDVARLLAETQTSSSLRSQQALVDVVSRGSGARFRRSSPGRSPSRASPSRRRRRDSGSPCTSWRPVGFSQVGVMSFVHHRGCLGNHWEVWGADPWVVEVLRYGYRLPFRFRFQPAPSGPGFYSRLFVTPKVSGGWRPMIDLSLLNRSVLVSSFHMETSASVLQSLRPGDWMVSLDLQDAYLQVPVHPSSRHYLRFCVGTSVLQFRTLCYGLSSAPQVFTRVMASISVIMHRYGFRILRYLDDWFVLGFSSREVVRARDFLLWLY